MKYPLDTEDSTSQVFNRRNWWNGIHYLHYVQILAHRLKLFLLLNATPVSRHLSHDTSLNTPLSQHLSHHTCVTTSLLRHLSQHTSITVSLFNTPVSPHLSHHTSVTAPLSPYLCHNTSLTTTLSPQLCHNTSLTTPVLPHLCPTILSPHLFHHLSSYVKRLSIINHHIGY